MIEEFQFVFKSLLSIWLIYYYGAILGLTLIYVLFMGYRLLMFKLFGLEMLLNLDKCFIGLSNRAKINLQCIMTFENFNAQAMRSLFVDKALMKLKKLRKKVVYKFGNYYWKDIVDLQEAYDRIKIIRNLKNEEEMTNFAQAEINNQIDTLKELPYEIFIIPYEQGDGGAVIWKFDHVMTDGLGMLSSICLLADNYDISIFPVMMRNYKYKWYMQILDYLQFIFYGPLVIKEMFSRDRNPSPFRQTPMSTGESNIAYSKLYDLNLLTQLRKDLSISFNDLIFCVFSRAFKKYSQMFEGKYHGKNDIRALMPIGRKEAPSCLEEARLNNEVSSLFIRIPIIDDIKTDHHKVSKVLNSSIKNSGYMSAGINFVKLSVEYLPISIQEPLADFFTDNIDLTVSNMPGPTVPLFYQGMRCTKITPMATTSRLRAFIPVFSYNKKFGLMMSVDKDSNIDNKEFIRIVEEEIEKLID
jgi:NRPS condensation-like uncharacterized protein